MTTGSSILAMTFAVPPQHRQVHVSIVRPHFTKSRRCDIRASMTALGVRRAKAAFFSGCKSHPATIAPAGSNRSSHGGDEMAG